MDPSNWGMAGSLVHAMAADGVDLDDQAAVDRWISRYNAGMAEFGDEEDDEDDVVDLKEAFGLPDQLAPVRLPEPGELAALARRAPLMAQLRKLAWWLGAGRAVTEDEELASGDAAEAAAELGLDVARLAHLWWLALDAEFIELDEDETHAIPGESAHAWDEGDDDEALDLWEMVFALVIGDALDARRIPGSGTVRRPGVLRTRSGAGGDAVPGPAGWPARGRDQRGDQDRRDGRAAARPGGQGLAVVGKRARRSRPAAPGPDGRTRTPSR